MNNDRQIIISAAGSRKATHWPQHTMWWSDFVEKFRIPARGTETLAEYLRYPKSTQDDLKDVGGFVGGTLKGNRRKANAVLGRDLLTLDLDNIPSGETQNILLRIDGLGCGYAVYSTRKHEEVRPRLRVVIPLSRTATADEYEPLARKVASIIGIELCDPSTFEAHRLMYWPSCSKDSQYVFRFGDKPILDTDGVLALYSDWRNVAEWPQVPGVQQAAQKLVQKQGDPTAKSGVVGTFCRIYDVYKALDELIPGVYEVCDIEGRFTYTGGSTTGGAIIYDNGTFLYSHHATDPAGGKLCNAFDLVRLHKFGDKDDEAKPDTPTNKLPSYAAMCQFAVSLPQVATLLNTERYEQAVKDFSDTSEDMGNWISKLQLDGNGNYAKTANNILMILENDLLLKAKIAFDEFANRGVVLGKMPWDEKEKTKERAWSDYDDSGLMWYLETKYKITGREKREGALMICSQRNSFDRVKDYLTSLSWDGAPRLDTLFIDYLGAADNVYVRAVTRKSFTAAVARAMKPGTKFDNMTIPTGPQGIGKSTLLQKMGKEWFSDSLKTFEGKEASEQIQGVWIVELGELNGLTKSETNAVKQFLSQREDIFRKAYGRRIEWYPRRCVFFGTSNDNEYLRDRTGNRRFWPVDVGVTQPTKSVFTELDAEIDQLWAEAFTRWQLGEPLFLSGEAETIALQEQERHRERSPREGMIIEFVERQIPEDWNKWDLCRRKMFWNDNFQTQDVKLVERDRICALEVWQELFDGDPKSMRLVESAEINAVIRAMDGWEKENNPGRHGIYKMQRGFKKASTPP